MSYKELKYFVCHNIKCRRAWSSNRSKGRSFEWCRCGCKVAWCIRAPALRLTFFCNECCLEWKTRIPKRTICCRKCNKEVDTNDVRDRDTLEDTIFRISELYRKISLTTSIVMRQDFAHKLRLMKDKFRNCLMDIYERCNEKKFGSKREMLKGRNRECAFVRD